MRAQLKQLLLILTTTMVLGTSHAETPIPDSSPAATPSSQPYLIPEAPALDVKGYVLMDATTGHIIASDNANTRLEPASLTKLMTLYLVFSAIQQGTISLEDKVYISEKAWHTGGSRMFIKAGEDVSVANLIQGVAVDSGNDASVALAEHVAGSEASFVDLMNMAAKRLGMTSSHFVDATGLPNDDHYSTPHDLALLTDAIVEQFPEQYHFFSEKWFTYADIRQPNRNRLLWRFKGADGLKTGHTNSAGYCLIASAKRDDMRLLTVVMGAPSDEARSADSIRLLTYGFRFFTTHKVFDANTALSTVTVWKGEEDEVKLGLQKPLVITLPAGSKQALKTAIKAPNGIEAPVKKGQNYGTVTVSLRGDVIATAPLVALEDDNEGGAWSKLSGNASMLFNKWFGDDEDDTAVQSTPATSEEKSTEATAKKSEEKAPKAEASGEVTSDQSAQPVDEQGLPAGDL